MRSVLDVAIKRETCLLTGFTEAEMDTLIALLHRLIANLPLVEAEAQVRRTAATTRSDSAGNATQCPGQPERK